MTTYEMLPPDELQHTLQVRLDSIRSAISALQSFLARPPAGRLRISMHNGSAQWYRVSGKAGAQGEYIPKENVALAKKLAQKAYNEKALGELLRQEAEILRFMSRYKPRHLDEIFMDAHQERRLLTTPLTLPEDEYIRRWLDVSFAKKTFATGDSFLQTTAGERMRSKSELLIAETLTQMKIPYRYEFPHRLIISKEGTSRRVTFNPDFTCLNVRTRKEFIWEHFGMMDKPDYLRNAMGKLDVYEANGFFYGVNLLFTMERDDCPLNLVQVRRLAEKFLK